MGRVSKEEYQKAKGQFRLQLNGIMDCFRCYGLNTDVDGATEEIVKLAEQLSNRLNGEDTPIQVRHEPRRRPTE